MAGRPGFNPRSSHTKDTKWYVMPSCLTLSIIRYRSRVKWSNLGKGVAPSSTPWCSSYRKGSLRVTLYYGRQLYLLTYYTIYLSPSVHIYLSILSIYLSILYCTVKKKTNMKTYRVSQKLIYFPLKITQNITIKS